jgi:hypothetical protein
VECDKIQEMIAEGNAEKTGPNELPAVCFGLEGWAFQ